MLCRVAGGDGAKHIVAHCGRLPRQELNRDMLDGSSQSSVFISSLTVQPSGMVSAWCKRTELEISRAAFVVKSVKAGESRCEILLQNP